MKNLVPTKLMRSAIIIALTWLAGCAGMDQYLPADAPLLTADQEIKVGSTVEDRLLQLLGGPRHDQALLEELDSLIKPEGGAPADSLSLLRTRVLQRSMRCRVAGLL